MNADSHPSGIMDQPRLGLRVMMVCLSMAIAAAYPPAALGQQPGPIATVVSVQGTVEAQRAGGTEWQPVKLKDTLQAGDKIRVRDKSRADLAMLDQSVLRLNANTTITIEAVKEERTGVVDLIKGAAHFFSRGPGSLDVKTPYTIAGVRGTEFLINVEANRTLLTIFEGTVLAQNPAGSLTLTGGQSAVAEAGKAPVLRVVARPRDAVQWALYYPPVVWFRPDEFAAGPGWQGKVRQSLEAYRKGDLQRAFDAIATVPDTVPDPRFFGYRASLLLAVGRVDEANADIGRALALKPNDPNALALQTIIALVQNDRHKALEVAQKAVEVAPDSATARIALSYAQQARFDLEGARASLEKAVELDPQNALAWARLAELWSSFGYLDKARDAAQRAVALDPDLSLTQTILGFAYLTEVDIKQAKAAFEKAIALDQAAALPRLGLGLAKIRDGDLDKGGRDIEIAASLDPNNSLIRSYLGKTYYEEKRTTLDEREYTVAKELDPQDPTPYFYDAIAKQTTNRPVEALRDYQKAVELNDNRAVYRSKLLLDSDLAARSAAQARIYTNLGFQQLALVEGWKSVNIDPSNFSAHRFLADSYAALPRHEIARVSELLQSQLLQPINITPIQPLLAESNLFLISAQGPGVLSFNEFNPLFNRDQVVVQTTGLVGEQDTYGGEGIVSGIYKKFSFSGSGNHFQSHGWRTNADQNDNIADAFAQLELSPKTSIQAEFRYRHSDRGDLRLRFFPDDFFPGERNKDETKTFRLGGRHAFSPGSTVLTSLMYQHKDTSLIDEQPPEPALLSLDIEIPESSYSAEAQHLFRSQYFNLTSGAGFFYVDGEINSTLGLDLPPPPVGPGPIDVSQTTLTQVHHFNAYGYGYVNWLKDVTFTVGVSVDALYGDFPGGDLTQWNPKFGVTWNPFPSTTVRGAIFSTVKRTLITDQTLEPTQVAGFNQFFDDFNLTQAWNYGGAIDQKFTENIWGGGEVTYRDLTVPFLDFTVDPANPPTREASWDEFLARAYLFWTPLPWFALRAEYQYEKLSRDTQFPEGVTKAHTHRVPLGATFFHPSGLGASLSGTYYHQDGDFTGAATGEPRSGVDAFWIVDMAINYRLPKRYGFITFGVTNLFNQGFQFFDNDLRNASIQPTRTIFGRVTLSFP